MAQIVFEGAVCIDCLMVIANDDWSGIANPDEHRAAIEDTALCELGAVVPGDMDTAYYGTEPCDYCATALHGDRYPIAVLD